MTSKQAARAAHLAILISLSLPAAAQEAPAPAVEAKPERSPAERLRDERMERIIEDLQRRVEELEAERDAAQTAREPRPEAARPDDKVARLAEVLSEFEFYGGAVASYSYNLIDPPGRKRTNAIRVSDVDHNSFTINHAKLGVARLLSGEDDWDAGGRIEVVAGRTVAETVSLDPEFLGDEELNLGKAYVSFQVPTGWKPIKVWVGRDYGWFGVESLDLYDSQLLSLSVFANFTPYINVGVFAEMELGEGFAYMQYVGNGSEVVVDNNDAKSVGGRLSWTHSPQDLYVALHWIYGPEQDDNVSNDRLQLELDVAWQPTRTTSVWVMGMYGFEEGADVNGGRAQFGGASLTLRQELVEVGVAEGEEEFRRFAVIARGTTFRDKGGANSGLSQTLNELTGAFEVKPTASSWVRLEYRADISSEDAAFAGSRGQASRSVQQTITAGAGIEF